MPCVPQRLRPEPLALTRYTSLLALAALALLPAAAGASPGQYALFQDDALLLEHGDGPRQATLDEVRGLGVDMIKVQLNWAAVAPGARRKPSGFDATDPAEYPGWARYDALLADARARGLKVMFALAPPAPGWATRGTRRDRAGVNRPSAREFGRFAEAAARRFPGRRRLDALERAEPPRPPLPAVGERPAGGAAHLPRHGPRRGARADARRRGRRPDPVRRAAADRQVEHRAEAQPEAAPLPALVLQPRQARSPASTASPTTPTRARRAVPHRALAGRRHDPLVRAHRARARLRARARAHRGQAAADLEHRVRLPDEPAGPVHGAAIARGAALLVGSPSSGSPIRTAASRASPSTR